MHVRGPEGVEESAVGNEKCRCFRDDTASLLLGCC